MKNNGLNRATREQPTPEQITREKSLYGVLAAVPPGRVVTYGQLAELAGLPGSARIVGRILSNLPEGTKLPWHRVINAAGKISLGEDNPSFKIQRARLQEEGVVLNNNRVSLKKFNWQP